MGSPGDIFKHDENRQNTFMFDKFNPIACAVSGFGLALFMNWALRRPLFSGIQRHIGFTIGGGLFGSYIDNKRNEYLAERDAIFRHYIELHPEDFPEKERRKWADVLEIWAPIR